jgi:hypothetical protein
MRMPETVKALEKLGRVQLSKSFFMREFLYSEISQIGQIPNIPDDPELTILAGKNPCENVLEPIQDVLGRISIRSAFRSCEVNQKGSETKESCSTNDKNYAEHIWDKRDKHGFMRATAFIIVTSFIPYYEQTNDWTALAWWIHDHISAYANMTFLPKYAAFNINWNENPGYEKFIYSDIENPHSSKSSGYLTKKGIDNFEGSHEDSYREWIRQIRTVS